MTTAIQRRRTNHIAAACAVATIACASLTACDGSGEGADLPTEPAPPPDAPAPPSMCVVSHWDGLMVGGPPRAFDVRGDGTSVEVTFAEAGRLTLNDGAELQKSIAVPNAWHSAKLAAGDVTGDGVNELIVTGYYYDVVMVFDLTDSSDVIVQALATISLVRDPGGLAVLFGEAVAVADMNRDGAADLVISAPGEGEEACVANEAVRVYLGPFTGTPIDGDAADYELAPPADVVPAQWVAGSEALSSRCWGYALTTMPDDTAVLSWVDTATSYDGVTFVMTERSLAGTLRLAGDAPSLALGAQATCESTTVEQS